MKNYRSLITCILLITCISSFADVIPRGYRPAHLCVKITNTASYPDISLIGVATTGTFGSYPPSPYVITPEKCLDKGYKFNDFNIYAVNKSYLNGNDISTINFATDRNALKSNIQIELFGGFEIDSSPITGREYYYRIAGFTGGSVVLYRWKEVHMFNDGRSDSITLHNYSGDSTVLSQKIITALHPVEYKHTVEFFPNPAHKNFQIRLNNFYIGIIPVTIYNLQGQAVQSFNILKTKVDIEHSAHLNRLPKGNYMVGLHFGNSVTTKKLTIQ